MDTLENLLKSEDVFVDERFLRIGYHPNSISEIKHRDVVIKQYISSLRELTKNLTPPNMLVFGKSGSGKSMITEVVLNEMKQYVSKNEILMNFVVIRCDNTRTDSKILKELISKLEEITGIEHPKMSNDLGEYFGWFCKLLDEYKGILIIVLDEIDKMKNPNLINSFSRILENDLAKRNTCIIGITNNMEFTDSLDAKTISALAHSQIVFPPYDAMQLYDILEDRASRAFVEGALDTMAIQLCAALAAQEHGDARKAIALLYAAGLHAREQMKSTITEDDVYQARSRADQKNTYTLVRSLPIHPKIILLACATLDKYTKRDIHTTDVYATYLQICGIIHKEPLSQRRVLELIGELEENGLLVTTMYSLGRKGLKKKVKSNQSPDIITIITEDNSFDSIEDVVKCIPLHLLNNKKKLVDQKFEYA